MVTGINEGSKIFGVGRQYLIAMVSECCDCCVDRVDEPGTSEQHPGTTSQLGIQWKRLDGHQRSGQPHLATGTTSPNLGDNAPMGNWWPAQLLGIFEPAPHGSVVALEGDERSCVENQSHQARRRFLRTVAAASRSS